MRDFIYKSFILKGCTFKNCCSTTADRGGGGVGDIFDTLIQTTISFCEFINCFAGDDFSTIGRDGGFFAITCYFLFCFEKEFSFLTQLKKRHLIQ
jgi:hypothetical protein